MNFVDTLSHVQHHLQRDCDLGMLGCTACKGVVVSELQETTVALIRPSVLLCGTDVHVEEDTFQLASRRMHLKHLSPAERRGVSPLDVLNFPEKKRLADYVTLWQQRPPPKCTFADLAVHLSDQPGLNKFGERTGWVCWSAASNSVPTLRKSGGIMFSPNAGRQFLLKELYAGMGYPSFNFLADEAGVPQFEVFQPMLGLNYSHMKEALGNSQHVASVGVFGAVALATTSQVPQVL